MNNNIENKYSDITLEVCTESIRHNYRYLCSKASNSVCAVVVKADCYGLGVNNIAPVFQDEGCRDFFVANFDEALNLRSILSDNSNIYVFHGVKEGEHEGFYQNNIIPVLNSFSQLEMWSDYSKQIGKKLPCIIHIDTGLNRLGINFEDLQKLYDFKPNEKLDVRYFMSHLSCILQPGHPLNHEQLEKTRVINSYFPDKPITLANSKGVIASEDYHFDMVRPGSALYGIKGKHYHGDIRHSVIVKGRIIQIREVQNDGFVGYGATKAIKKGSRLAVVPIGYADGYMRILSDNIHAYFGEFKIPAVGIISMDMTIFDISDIPESQINEGDEIELVSSRIPVDELAEKAGTIGYEIMTSFGSRYKRVYK